MRRIVLSLAVAVVLSGQTPDALANYFSGRQMSVSLDMPGDDSGVDVQARGPALVDEGVVRERLTKYGVGVRRGQTAAITLVKVKGDHIEVHLNGGGFTNRQFLGLPGYDSVHWGMSDEEKKIRRSISGTRDKDRIRQLESDYDRVRQRRVRPLRAKLEREERARFGSRFNVRFPSARDAARVTPEELAGILRPLAELR